MRAAFLCLIFLMSLNVNASVLTLPENIIVISVDGVEQPSHFFARETRLDLPKGQHILVLKYQDLFDGDDDHTKVSSKPFVLLFTLTKNEAITVKPPILEELSAAKKFAKKPEVKLLNASGNEIASVSQSLIKFNAQGTLAQLANASAEPAPRVDKKAEQHADLGAKVVFDNLCMNKGTKPLAQLEQLKCLWKASNKAQQEAFIYFLLAEQQSMLKTLKKGN